MQKLLLIDGNSLTHRAFYALPIMTSSSGLHTNAVYGFANMLIKLIKKVKPNYIVSAFDKGKISFRTKLYDKYKVHREATPNELSEQFPLIRELLQAIGIKSIDYLGYEADDIIGTLGTKAVRQNYKIIILTSDKDMFQLINDNTEVWLIQKGISKIVIINNHNIEKIYNIKPKNIVDLKALMGDISDNIPGIKGIGEKTALKLLKRYNCLDKLYENLDSITGTLQNKLKMNKEIAYLSKYLATIDCDIEFIRNINIEKCILQPNYQQINDLCDKLSFSSLRDKMLELCNRKKENIYSFNDNKLEKETSIYNYIKNKKGVENIAKRIKKSSGKNISFYPIIKGKTGSYQIEGLALVIEKEKFFIPGLLVKKICNSLLKLKYLRSYDLKSFLSIFRNNIFKKTIVEDIKVMAYLLYPTENVLKIEKLQKILLPQWHNSWDQQEIERAINIATFVDVVIPILKGKLYSQNMSKVYYNIESHLISILAQMEKYGIRINVEQVNSLSKQFKQRIKELLKQIQNLAGIEFNVNSTKQLSEILFKKLQIPAVKKTKSGYSTDIEVLEKLKKTHPIIELILEYRSLNKLTFTYLDSLKSMINPFTNKIHTDFNQTVTATGRLSSSDPNLQNIPIRSSIGTKIRELFIPDNNFDYLVSADYSQIELRILAHLSKEPALIDSFIKNEDIHKRTAAKVLGISLNKVNNNMRNKAKAVNFGIIYGLSDYGLALYLGIKRKEAAQFIEAYFSQYPLVKNYIEHITAMARNKGYTETMFDRKRNLPGINSSNYNIRSFAERIAVNTPIQGTASDIIKLAMINIVKEFKKEKLKSKLILQLHDELIVETIKNELDKVKKILKNRMENAVILNVPLVVSISVGKNWESFKKYA